MTSELLIVLALIVANGFFSGSEIAIVTLRSTRLQELLERGDRSAKAALALRKEPERFLATVQIGITVVGATAAAFGGASIARRIEPAIAALPGLADYANEIALGLVVALVSYLSIVIGELVPKSIALRAAERFGLLVARPLLVLSYVARPFVWLLTASSNVLLKPFGDRTNFGEALYSTEELQELMHEAARTSGLDPRAAEIAARALALPELTAFDVMVPRTKVAMLPIDASHADVMREIDAHTHTRFPVYGEDRDDIVGYVNIKDLVRRQFAPESRPLREVLRPPFFTPETKRAIDLLREMQEQRLRLAIVVDGQGGVEGIVTDEDLVEELVGDLFGEHAQEGTRPLVRESESSAIVAGTMPLRDLNRLLDLDLPEDGEWTTIAGLCIHVSGSIPAKGATMQLDPHTSAEILDATERRIRSLRLRFERPNAANGSLSSP